MLDRRNSRCCAAGACLLLLLSACGRSLPGAVEPAPAADLPAVPAGEKALSAYLHDLSVKDDSITVASAKLEHYSIPVSDGTTLDGWVRRPPGDAPQPLVIVYSPYYGGGDPSSQANALGDPSLSFAEHLLPYGYAVGFISVGGTGNSGGCFRDGGAVERKQLADSVTYMTSQPWSNGKLAAIGVSYDGTTANELFVEAPPGLATVVPMEAITDYYRYSFNNGNLRGTNGTFTTYYYPIVGAAPAGLEGGVSPTDPPGTVQELSGEPCPDQLAIQQESAHGTLTVDKTPYWHQRDAIELVLASVIKPRPPMFFIEGFEDANVDPQMADGYIEAVKQTGVPLHAWFGQWVHAYPESTGCKQLQPCRADFFETALLAWFDQYLKGRNTGILDAPRVQLQADDGIWRHEDDWPPPQAQFVDFHPATDGSFGTTPTSGTKNYTDNTVTVNEGDPVPVVQSGTFLEFVSTPLPRTLRLTGLPRLETQATADDRRANLVATLLARMPDGTQRYLNFAAINLNHAASLDTGDTDITGKALDVAVNFFPQDNVIPAGARLVLELGGDVTGTHTTSGDSSNLLNGGPNLMTVGMGATVTLDLARTRIRLPVNSADRVEPVTWPAAGP